MSEPIRLAISTCPNDTFAFHAILNRRIDLRGLDLQISLLDISELNAGLFCGKFDVAKCSFHAALKLSQDYLLLRAGAALGFGNGPLLLSSQRGAIPENDDQTVLCPGPNTTATLLFKMFYEGPCIEHRVFSKIMSELKAGHADFGVCIHEGRFTYQSSKLYLVADLGKQWEQETQCPLPLGGIVARKDLPQETTATIQQLIQQSIQYGLANRTETAATMRKYAQEFSDAVLFEHVDLYVNDWTVDLGVEGMATIDRFNELAIEKLDLQRDLRLQIFDG